MELPYSLQRAMAEQTNKYLAKQDQLIRIEKRLFHMMQRMNIAGNINTYIEPVELDRVRDNNYI